MSRKENLTRFAISKAVNNMKKSMHEAEHRSSYEAGKAEGYKYAITFIETALNEVEETFNGGNDDAREID